MLLIHNGSLVSGAGVQQADVLVDGERIAAVIEGHLPGLGGLGPDVQIVDASGLLVFPGLIDVHTHMRQPGGEQKEDFYTGACAALAGGVTSIFAMPNTSPAVTDRATLDLALDLARQNAVCDYGVFLGATNTNQRLKLDNPDLRECGLKMYMGSSTGDLLVEDFGAQYEHFQQYPRERVIAVHAEHEPAVRYFGQHGERRPHIAAELEVARAVALAERCDRRVHVCHVSSRREVEIIRDAKARGVPVTCEYAPHYLFLTTDFEHGQITESRGLQDYQPGQALHPAALYQMNPPLRQESDIETLWANLAVADCIATDHAPHTLDEKRSAKPPSGVPGLETMLPLLLTAAHEGRLELADVARLCCEGPARAFAIQAKGRIAPGFDADMTLVDPQEQWVIGDRPILSKCGWTPFAGWHVRGAVKQVFLRGRLAFADGKVIAARGAGKRIVN
ncbi:MAG: dihydroorotase family protein [Chloroflexi bacterium]|nr:dihydroorotase family protein [Chloroflexota bacterium]MCL5274966.1 dihydroorotase family protein [Chloroflexota bacterium]